MHLNVKLTPPQSDGPEGSTADTPKTPEILNSLISLSTSSSVSSTTSNESISLSELEDTPVTTIKNIDGHQGQPSTATVIPGVQYSPSSSDSDHGGCCSVPTNITNSSESLQTPIGCIMTSPKPQLLSPVSTVEATKSALIKEGLKHQIKSKLSAAGVKTIEPSILPKKVKDELTPEDEERRLRRRERNKVAATKCRNKKKERAVILISEAIDAENQNINLKHEIQKLTDEKQRLEKIIESPDHLLSCKYKFSSRKVREKSNNSSCESIHTNEVVVTTKSSSKDINMTYKKQIVTKTPITVHLADVTTTSPKSTETRFQNPSHFNISSSTAFTQSLSNESSNVELSGGVSKSLPSLDIPYTHTNSRKTDYILQPLSSPSSTTLQSPTSQFFTQINTSPTSAATLNSSSVLLSPDSPINFYQPYENEELVASGSYVSYCNNGFCFSSDFRETTVANNNTDLTYPHSFIFNDISTEHESTSPYNKANVISDQKSPFQSRYTSYDSSYTSPIPDYNNFENFGNTNFVGHHVHNETYSESTSGKFILDISSQDPIYTSY